MWNSQYRNLYQLQIVIDKCSEGGEEKGNFLNLAIGQILTAYNLAMLTDLMGDVLYSEAMQPRVIYQPKLDKQEDLYVIVFNMLDEAIANLGKTFTFPSIGNQDPKWLKAANALKSRYTMRLSLKDPNYIAPNGEPEQVQKKYGISDLTNATNPTRLISYHEIQFLKAEAYARMSPAQIENAESALKYIMTTED